ncbi:hypothetical protein [Xanthomarina gelatinilytica]|uniref:Uncharacterized protein n=1 Tax=Xanthomarina gelatinilytica TaxID=1137281 RepID=A0A3D6BP23_9FLAO|nr:hypothetical protein [Xanthomarina gelatinilytica]
MTINEFNLLENHIKFDLTFNQGTFIEYFINGNQRFALYSIFKLYVEVEYNSIENKIVNIISFDDGELLEKYSFFR